MNKRDTNLDLLRVISCIMVISLHVGAIYGNEINIEYPSYYFTVGNFYHSITRTAVPIFIILSGYFLLNDNRNLNINYHYKKTIKRIIIPTLIFSFLYVIYSIGIGIIKNGMCFDFLEPFMNWLNGKPFYHMWYMYMIIGLYLITPFLIKIRQSIGDKKFEFCGWIFMIIGMLINIPNITIIWPLQFVIYLGYFILGYSLNNRVKIFKGSYKIYLIVSIIISIVIFILTEFNIRYGLLENKFYFLTPLSPFVVVSSLLLYISFIKIDFIKYDFSLLSQQTFYIYLFHAVVISVIDFIANIFIKNINPIWYIPMLVIVVFIISYLLALITNNVIKMMKSKILAMILDN